MIRLFPLPVQRLPELVDDREGLAKLAGSTPAPEWPSQELRDALTYLVPQGAILYAIVRDGEIVGDVGFHGPPDERGAVEVGFFVVPSARGKGVMTEALDCIARDAFERGVSIIRARCKIDNLASVRVLEKAGFRRMGEADRVIEWELYSARQCSPRST